MQLKEELQAQEEKTDAIENLNSVLLVKEHMINQELQEARKESIEVWLYSPTFCIQFASCFALLVPSPKHANNVLAILPCRACKIC